MNVLFDVDLTIISAHLELRPHVKEVMATFKETGHNAYVWSTGGKSYVEEIVRRRDLGKTVDGCFGKFGETPVRPDFCVDDLKEYMETFGGYLVRPSVSLTSSDREMLEALRVILSRDST